ncbi:MAG: proteasome ATPase [Acidobacteria bacterium]|nr:proteasome ATPase [Acidobacteriota bacterium]
MGASRAGASQGGVPVRGSEREPRGGDHEKEIAELRSQVAFLEEEAALMRRRVGEPGRQGRVLEDKLAEARARLSHVLGQNERLASTLKEAREQILALKEEVEKLTAPPSAFGVYMSTNEDGTVDIVTGGRKLRVAVHPDVDPKGMVKGQEVMLNEAMNVIAMRAFEAQGEVVTLKEIIDSERAIVVGHADEERVVYLAEPLRGQRLRSGDSLMIDGRSGYAFERLPKPEVEELILEEVPDITYRDIGGLRGQIEAIRDAVELPFLHADLFAEHKLKAPKGVLLYGPPGCGKTLIAKAVANSLARQVGEQGEGPNAKSYFLNIKGPELLNKYVGETERQIRLIFQRAKEKSEEGFPVIVFFDEMDSIFRTRGSGISSDVENTVVPQLLSEIDGVETLTNVIVIGASNREDMIDPAILRPGRLDVKIKIERPDREAAREVFRIYLTPDLPLHEDEIRKHGSAEKAVEAMIAVTCERMYAESDENRFLEVTYANGDKEILYFKDFNSGAMVENVVARAKKEAIKRLLATGERGIRGQDLLDAIRSEFKENEDLPNTTNPDDWARISGKKGERIVYVRTLLSEGTKGSPRAIETVATGQYL